ncbi:hypothetical protein HPP92_003494 [Vanilla planifolia]|uniref:Uncharacterized protein n=1 Tax=Vanilla planifolia TaxID=51239 RepID=A0A835VFX4_VANPL|nr:hypothetical protein HPP92_003885 [Vanilla planifolia]KAG0503422.1 hypothetical protein HPP92_003494 [Vanilla planifolia]
MALPCNPSLPPTLQNSSPPCLSPSPTFPSPSVKPSFSTLNGSSKCSSSTKLGREKWLGDLCVPVYSTSEVIEKMREGKANGMLEEHPYRAMYSSLLGGIIMDPALMVVPMDDHMVHRGHGVFDTAMLVNGYLYDLDAHLDRFLRSASAAKISHPYPHETLRGIVLLLAAASRLKTGSLRYWLSSGPGDFSLSPPSNPRPAFYSLAMETTFSRELEG